MISIILAEPGGPEKEDGSDGITHKPEPGGAMMTGHVVVPHKDFTSTSLADTLFHTGKTPTFADRKRAQGGAVDDYLVCHDDGKNEKIEQ